MCRKFASRVSSAAEFQRLSPKVVDERVCRFMLQDENFKSFKNAWHWFDALLTREYCCSRIPRGLQLLAGGGGVPGYFVHNCRQAALLPFSAAAYPLFGRFRSDIQPDLAALAGDVNPPTLIIPVDLSCIADVDVSSLENLGSVLRNANEACVLLANQRNLLANSYVLRFQLIRHLILEVRSSSLYKSLVI